MNSTAQTTQVFTRSVFLSDTEDTVPVLRMSGKDVNFTKVTNTPQGVFWRAGQTIAPGKAAKTIDYHLLVNNVPLADSTKRNFWQFNVPGVDDKPKLAYASCNGFSSNKLARDTENPYALWAEMQKQHQAEPFSLLLMGGDQVYADGLWESDKNPSLKVWSFLERKDQIKAPLTPKLAKEVDLYYGQLYINAWNATPSMALMLASIPSVMMWDDHDIFDGWGSYPDELLGCPVYQAIFKAARKYFELFQVRSPANKNLLNVGNGHYAMGLQFGDYTVLAVDTRVARTTDIIMAETQWQDVKAWLKSLEGKSVKQFLSMVSLPLAYRDFSGIDVVLQGTPWNEELEDDAHDHWTVKRHQGERMRLIRNLLDFTKAHGCKSVVLSGDVHIGALGLIRDQAQGTGLVQVVSSGIVHPAPALFEWCGVKIATGESKQVLGDVTVEMTKPFGSDEHIISRNFATLKMGTDKKLWVNWVCENGLKPVYAV